MIGVCRSPAALNQMLHLIGAIIVVSSNPKLLQRPRHEGLVVRPLKPDGGLLTVTPARSCEPAGAMQNREAEL
jgi:hypothetical protein